MLILRLPLVALALLLAPVARAATLEVRIYTTDERDTATQFDETFSHEIDGPTSLSVQTEPHLMAIQWNYISGPYFGVVRGFPDAVVYVQLEVAADARAGTLASQITSPLNGDWFPEPVEVAWFLDPEGAWAWRLPNPPLLPDTYTNFTNPRNIYVALSGPQGATVPEPGLWLLLGLMASLARNVRGR
jgi:hypothetical protein